MKKKIKRIIGGIIVTFFIILFIVGCIDIIIDKGILYFLALIFFVIILTRLQSLVKHWIFD